MKKRIIFPILALVLVALTGCQLAGLAPAVTTQPTTVSTQSQVELPLTKQAAIQLALDHAGVSNEEVKHLHAWLDRDSGAYHYDVDFRHGEYYYAYEISEETGKILKLETEHERTQLPQTQIAKEEAVRIALEHEAFTEADVTRLTAEFDGEDHRYEVEFVKDGIEYTYEICAEYGKILDIDKERIH